MTRLNQTAYATIADRARAHILAGGGIVPDTGGSNYDDTIGKIAEAHFNAKRADQEFAKAIAGFEYSEHEAIHGAAWSIVTAYTDAAFAFGAAVAFQLQALHAAPQPRRQRAKKGGTR